METKTWTRYKTPLTVSHIKPSYSATITGRTNPNKKIFTVKNKGMKTLTVLASGKYYDVKMQLMIKKQLDQKAVQISMCFHTFSDQF